jgi:hypothetical protein
MERQERIRGDNRALRAGGRDFIAGASLLFSPLHFTLFLRWKQPSWLGFLHGSKGAYAGDNACAGDRIVVTRDAKRSG